VKLKETFCLRQNKTELGVLKCAVQGRVRHWRIRSFPWTSEDGGIAPCPFKMEATGGAFS